MRALSFGSVALEYERYRLGYPSELVDVVLDYAERPVHSALEVGAGTGKATRLFAGRGIAVTALEPDAGMAEVLARKTCGMPVHPVASTFERFATARRFDLLYAAAAWHWTDPASRWTRAVGLLAPGGVLAVFGIPGDLTDPDLQAAVDEIEKQVLTPDDSSSISPWTVEDVGGVDGLTHAVQHDVPWSVSSTASAFVDRLSTFSAYLRLDPPARADAFDRLRDVLPDRFDIDATVRMTLARRV